MTSEPASSADVASDARPRRPRKLGGKPAHPRDRESPQLLRGVAALVTGAEELEAGRRFFSIPQGAASGLLERLRRRDPAVRICLDHLERLRVAAGIDRAHPGWAVDAVEMDWAVDELLARPEAASPGEVFGDFEFRWEMLIGLAEERMRRGEGESAALRRVIALLARQLAAEGEEDPSPGRGSRRVSADASPSPRELLAVAAAESIARIRCDRGRVGRRLEPLLAYLEEHIFEGSLDLNTARKACGIRDNGLSIRFHSILGRPPYGYIEDRRLETAARLLVDTSLRIWRIAEVTGYSSLQVFSRAFGRWSGKRPLAYRLERTRSFELSTAERAAAAGAGSC